MKWPRMHAVVGVKVPQDVFEWMIGQFDSGLGSGVCVRGCHLRVNTTKLMSPQTDVLHKAAALFISGSSFLYLFLSSTPFTASHTRMSWSVSLEPVSASLFTPQESRSIR